MSLEDVKKLRWKASDYSKLQNEEFRRAIADVKSIAELSGVANRRRVLNNPNLSTWSDEQKQIILQRKYELERDG
jgi:hypothetical protein